MYLRTEAAVNTEELLVHQSCQGETVECLHAGVVDILSVLYFTCNGHYERYILQRRKHDQMKLTFLLEGEVLRQVAALVVAAQQEEGGGVTHLQRPQIQNTLHGGMLAGTHRAYSQVFIVVTSILKYPLST